MTRPSIDDLKRAVALSCQMRGCTCEPDITITQMDHGAYITVDHDPTCPATTDPRMN